MKYADSLNEFALAFDPDELGGDDINKFYYDGTMPIRMNDIYQSPMDDIFNSCLLVKHQNAHLLLGHRGCGKSTELNVLKRRFVESGRKVSVVQCLLEADIQGLTYWDLLILMGKHLIMIAEEAECVLPQTLINNINDFWKDVEITTTKMNAIGLNTTAGASINAPFKFPLINFFANLSGELKYGYDKRKTIREKIKNNTGQWIGYMMEAADYITTDLKGKQPIIIYEDLDKLSPEIAWDVFTNPLSQMPFPVIYTFPISLSYSPRFAQLEATFSNNTHILPMIKIRTPDAEIFQPGIQTITNIIEKRGALDLFDKDALSYLVEKTGGILRDLFNCITRAADRACNRNAGKIEFEDAVAVTIQLRSMLTRRIEVKNYPLLRNISIDKKFKENIEDREMMLNMMEGLIVLEYNGDRWHDLHPLVEDYLKKHGELN